MAAGLTCRSIVDNMAVTRRAATEKLNGADWPGTVDEKADVIAGVKGFTGRGF